MLALSARAHVAPTVTVAHRAPRATRRAPCATVVVDATATRASKTSGAHALAASAVVAASTALVALPALADTIASDAATQELSKNPAFLGFSCVAVCWGIPQMLGTAILEKKEANGRALLKRAGIDTSDIGPGNWGKIQRLCQDNGIDYKEQIL